MKTLVVGDVHLVEKALPEITEIKEEIIGIITKSKPNRLVVLGDIFDKKHPTPLEIKFFAKLCYDFSQLVKEIVIITGNHDIVSKTLSTIQFCDYISSNITIIDKSEWIDEQGIYYGHYFTDSSLYNYGSLDSGKSTKELSETYKLVFLGHQHTFQTLADNAWHLGSIYYVSFGETMYITEPKKVALIDNLIVEFIDLKSVIPMHSVSDTSVLSTLDTKSKVRVTFTDFNVYKNQINNLDQYKDKFHQFKIKLDFKNNNAKTLGVASRNLGTNTKTVINTWLDSIQDTTVKTILTDEIKTLYDN